MKKLVIILLSLFPVLSYGQKEVELVHFDNPSTVSTPKGYSHAVKVDLGTCEMVIISGQIALDKDGNLVGKNDLAKQTEQVFLNLKNVIEAEGGTMNDLVKFSFFMIDASQVQVVRDVRNKFVNVQKPPASTLVQISKLFRDDLLIEIEATAIIPKKKKKSTKH